MIKNFRPGLPGCRCVTTRAIFTQLSLVRIIMAGLTVRLNAAELVDHLYGCSGVTLKTIDVAVLTFQRKIRLIVAESTGSNNIPLRGYVTGLAG